MACEHQDSCVECLKAELNSVRAQQATLVADLQGLLSRGGRACSKDGTSQPGARSPHGRAPEGSKDIIPALTPPDSPNRKLKAEAAVESGSLVIPVVPSESPKASVIIWRKKPSPFEGETAEASDKALKSSPEAPWKTAVATAGINAVAQGLIAEATRAEEAEQKSGKPAAKKKKAQTGERPATKASNPAKARADTSNKGGNKSPASTKANLSPKDFIDIIEASRLTGKSVSFLSNSCRHGRLPSIGSYSGMLLLKRADVLKYASNPTKKLQTKYSRKDGA